MRARRKSDRASLSAIGRRAARASLTVWGVLGVLGGASPSCKSSGGSSKTSSPLCTAAAPGPAPLRRLTRFEIGRSLATAAGASDPRAAVTAVIAAMVQSPAFIYRPEAQAALGTKLAPSALATRLAYLVTSSAPDAALLVAAADASLMTSAGLSAHT